MADEIIEELWNIKDSIARDYAYSVDNLVAHLTAKGLSSGQKVVDLHAMKDEKCCKLSLYPCLTT